MRHSISCVIGIKTGSENDLDTQFFPQFLVPVPDRDFGDPCHFCHFALGAPLPAEDCGDVDGRCRDTTRSPAVRQFMLGGLPEDLNGPALDLSLEVEARAEARYVIDRGGREGALRQTRGR